MELHKHFTTFWINDYEVEADVFYAYAPAEYEQGHLFMPEQYSIEKVLIYLPSALEDKIIEEIKIEKEIAKRCAA